MDVRLSSNSSELIRNRFDKKPTGSGPRSEKTARVTRIMRRRVPGGTPGFQSKCPLFRLIHEYGGQYFRIHPCNQYVRWPIHFTNRGQTTHKPRKPGTQTAQTGDRPRFLPQTGDRPRFTPKIAGQILVQQPCADARTVLEWRACRSLPLPALQNVYCQVRNCH